MTHPKEILEAALRLEPTERAALAAEILDSLSDSTYGDLSPAWEAEIQRRARKFDAGRQAFPSDEVFAEIEASLRPDRATR